MELNSRTKNNNLKAIVIILGLLFIGSLGYIFKMSSDKTEIENELRFEKDEKKNILEELENLKIIYDQAIEDNTAKSDDLIAEREKVLNLIEEIKTLKGNNINLSKYKEEYFKLQSQMKVLIAENNDLKVKNIRLENLVDSTETQLNSQKNYSNQLSQQNEELSNKVAIASKLKYSNLKVTGFRNKNSGKKIETDKLSRLDQLDVCFTINENVVAPKSSLRYFLQIIDVNGNIKGDNKIELIGKEKLIYSYDILVEYDGTKKEVCKIFPSNNLNLSKGDYFINLFDKNELILSTSYNIR